VELQSLSEILIVFVLLALLAPAATLPAFLALRGKASNRRTILVSPIFGAVAVGFLAAAYISLFTGNALAIIYWVMPLMVAAWVIGVLFTAVMTAVAEIGRKRRFSRTRT